MKFVIHHLYFSLKITIEFGNISLTQYQHPNIKHEHEITQVIYPQKSETGLGSFLLCAFSATRLGVRIKLSPYWSNGNQGDAFLSVIG